MPMSAYRAFWVKDDGSLGWGGCGGTVQSTKAPGCFEYAPNAELGGSGQRMKEAKMAARILD